MVGLANPRAMHEAHPARIAIAIRHMRDGGDLWVTEGVITSCGR